MFAGRCHVNVTAAVWVPGFMTKPECMSRLNKVKSTMLERLHAGAGPYGFSVLRAKHRSLTMRPPIKCSWMMRSTFSGVTSRYHAPSG
jgi:hypothetical protein